MLYMIYPGHVYVFYYTIIGTQPQANHWIVRKVKNSAYCLMQFGGLNE